MKKQILALFTLTLVGLTYNLATQEGSAFSSSGGAPGSGSCATSNCHAGALQTSDKFEMVVTDTNDELVTGYTPGELYLINVVWNQFGGQSTKIGFALSSSKGTFLTDPSNDRYQVVNGYATHTSTGTSAGPFPKAWSVLWQAPASGDADFTSYINITNSNNSTSGDSVYKKEITFKPLNSGLKDNAAIAGLKVFPNPVTENIGVSFALKEKSSVNVSIISLDGKLVKSLHQDEMTAGNHNLSFANTLPKGLYILHVNANNQVATSRILVK